MKKILSLFLAAVMVTGLCSACTKEETITQNSNLDTSQEVHLKVCGGWTDCKAIENAAQAFQEIYPNCTIEYEYLQNYEESLVKRLKDSPDSMDLFLTSNIQEDSPAYPYAQDLYALENLDLSNTNEALIRNFTFKNTDTSAPEQIYAIPLGGELRGMYVNKTLLNSLNLKVPTTLSELLEDCQVLKDAGYIPMNGNPGDFSQRLLYPYVCNMIANAKDYDATYQKVDACEDGVSELFRQPMEVMYTLMEHGYYNYKYVETELNMFTDMSMEATARDFFHITGEDGNYQKQDDVGTVAFMSGVLSHNSIMEETKDDYHSKIEYEFILSPVSEDGGYAYVSPGHGIALNKNSAQMDWSAEFLNYLFTREGNTAFAEDINYIPNTKDSFSTIKEMYDIPDNQISDLGQATFSYDFYAIINQSLTETSKGNNPKYMNTDENGNAVLYDFDYYMGHLEDAFAAQRESGN